jgi:hypothetical protein
MAFFDAQGGVDFFGYPRTEQIVLDGRLVQYFQRARMEYFPEQAGTPFVVQLTLLGDQVTAGRRPFPTATLPPGGGAPAGGQGGAAAPTPSPDGSPIADPSSDALFFPQVNHTIRGVFRRYFDADGGLLRLGYPISEELQETNDDGSGRTYTVQYFQRARVEDHPDQSGTVYEMQLGLLGDQVLRERGWLPG